MIVMPNPIVSSGGPGSNIMISDVEGLQTQLNNKASSDAVFSGRYADLSGKPSFNRQLLFSGNLNSANQDLNDIERIYNWTGSSSDADVLSVSSANTFTFKHTGLFLISTALIVTDATANDRAVTFAWMRHLDSSGNTLHDHAISSSLYIRDDSYADKGMAGGVITFAFNANEKMQIRTTRVYSQDGRDDNPANASQSYLLIYRVDGV